MINRYLNEIDVEQLKNIQRTCGSSHVMSTCQLDDEFYYLKFSNEWLNHGVDPSLQILIEFLAYRIYQLYPNIKIPSKIQLVYDKNRKKVGLATSAVSGEMSGNMLYYNKITPQELGEMMSAGVYVDIFLANYDVMGTGTGNVIIDKDSATRIDPGGSMTFSATGKRKEKVFDPEASHLSSMFDLNNSSGEVFQYVDLKIASETFKTVSWSKIEKTLQETYLEIRQQLEQHNLERLSREWQVEFRHILNILKSRYKRILENIEELA